VVRRQNSQTHMITRPVSALRQPSITAGRPSTTAPMSYSPPFALSTTPPFAISTSRPISRPPSIPQGLNAFPPQTIPYDPTQRISVSPSSLQTGALARALTNTALRIYDASTAAANTALSRATSQTHANAFPRRSSTSSSTRPAHPLEQDLLKTVEDLSRKAYALLDLADSRLQTYSTLAKSMENRPVPSAVRRKSSSSSFNSEVMVLRQQEVCAGEAVVLYNKGLGYVYKGIVAIQGYWEREGGGELSGEVNDCEYSCSQEGGDADVFGGNSGSVVERKV
jgi:serine/threonine-protein kinase ULK/ATG1